MLLFGSIEQVWACSCFKQKSVCEAFGEAKAVFVGKVLEGESPERMSDMIGRNSNDNSFKIKVIEAFTGVEKDETISIHTGLGFGDCGFPFQKDETYLIYAYESKGQLRTNICMRSSHISREDFNQEDFKFLRNLSKNEEGATIKGKVNLYARDSGNSPLFPIPKNQKLLLERVDKKQTAVEIEVNEKGEYQISKLVTGSYKLAPILSSYQTVSDYETEEFWLNNKGCSQKDFFIKNDSKIEGKVIDDKGNAIMDDIWLDLIPKNLSFEPDQDILGEKGSFSFYNVPPGNYHIAVNFVYAPSSKSPFPKTLLIPIEVGLGQKIQNLIVQLPPRLSIIEIKGKLVWEDGGNAKNISLFLHDPGTDEIITIVETDKDGNFTIKGLKDQNYYIETGFLEKTINNEKVNFNAKSSDIKLEKPIDNLVLVIKKVDKK
jgi:hypothetical protein